MMEGKLDTALRSRDIEKLLSLWSTGGSQSRRLVRTLAADGAREWAVCLVAQGPQGARLAAAVLGATQGEPQTLVNPLRTLATHVDCAVREAAARALGEQLTRRFADVLPIAITWRKDPEPVVRRAAILATTRAAATGNLSWSEPLLRFVTPLLPDRSPEVRRTLGPGVLREVYLEVFPDDTLEYLAQWSTSHDAQVLWHVAMTLAGPAGKKVAGKGVIILRRLALDERPPVRGAVTAALSALAYYAPDVVLPKLRTWLGDEDRAPIARAAIRRAA